MAERMGWWSLAEENRGLCWWYVNRYFPYAGDEEKDELAAEAMVPLIKAAKAYRPDYLVRGKPVKFSTLAAKAIAFHFRSRWVAANTMSRGGGTVQTTSLSEFLDAEGDYLSDGEVRAIGRYDPEPELENAEYLNWLLSVTELPERTKEFLRLHFCEGLRQKEIGQRYGVHPKSVQYAITTGLLLLWESSIRLAA